MKHILISLSSAFLALGGMMTLSTVSYADVPTPQQLFSDIPDPYSVPVHLKGTITDSLGNVDTTFIDGYDPINREKNSTISSQVGAGGFSETISGQAIQIGDHLWERSTPPGGGWKEKTAPFKQKHFPLELLSPYIADYHQIGGKVVRGHNTTGVEFDITGKGMQLIEKLSEQNATIVPNIIKKAQMQLWFGTGNHLREVKLKETCVQYGHQYFVYSKTVYYDFGKALHLSPPT